MLTRADISRISQTLRQRFVWARGAHLSLSGWKWFRNATSQKFIECLLTVNDQFDTVREGEGLQREMERERKRVLVYNLTFSSLLSMAGLYIDRFFIAKLLLLCIFLVWSIKSFGICERMSMRLSLSEMNFVIYCWIKWDFVYSKIVKSLHNNPQFQFWCDYFLFFFLPFSFRWKTILRMNFPRGGDFYWCWWKGVRLSIVLNIDKFKRKLCVRFNLGWFCVCGLLEKASTTCTDTAPTDEKKPTPKCAHVCEIMHLSVHYWNACNP